MTEINWNDAPEGAERYCNVATVFHRWLKSSGDSIYFHVQLNGGYWFEYSGDHGLQHWENATPRPSTSEINWNDAPDGAERWSMLIGRWIMRINGGLVFYYESKGKWSMLEVAIDHTWENATPRPNAPKPPNDIEKTVNERGERYGKFTDGAEIMQSLKNVMYEAEGWSRLTPSQREGLEMIQHKIGRVLNGDPNYDDNYRDIAGYATLLLDECNGVNR